MSNVGYILRSKAIIYTHIFIWFSYVVKITWLASELNNYYISDYIILIWFSYDTYDMILIHCMMPFLSSHIGTFILESSFSPIKVLGVDIVFCGLYFLTLMKSHYFCFIKGNVHKFFRMPLRCYKSNVKQKNSILLWFH